MTGVLLSGLTGAVVWGKALPLPGWKMPDGGVPPAGMEQVTQVLRGWDQPVAVEGQQAELDPRTPVVGIRLGEATRAYVVPADHRPGLVLAGTGRGGAKPAADGGKQAKTGQDFLIHDTIGQQRVTLAFSGRDNQIVVLRWLPDGRRERVPFEVTRWRAWRKTHPNSQVVVGEADDKASNMATADPAHRDPDPA